MNKKISGVVVACSLFTTSFAQAAIKTQEDLGGRFARNASDNCEVAVDAKEFVPGVYFYSLIIDRQNKDTRQIVLNNNLN